MLQERILNTLDKRDDIDQRKLSKIAGVNESSISRYLNGYDVLNLASVLKIVQYLYPEEEKGIMADYVLTQKSRNARFALEYCDFNNLPNHLEQLIEQLSVSVNPVDREWAKLYRFIRIFKMKALPLEELLWEVEVFDPKELEMKIMKQILKGYIYTELGDFSSLTIHTKYTESFIKQVRTEFLKDCYNIRMGMIMNYVYLYGNNVEKAREYSLLVLNQDFFEYVKAIAYNQLGQSYMLEDYEKSQRYLKTAVSLFNKYNKNEYREIALRNLSFLQSYWKIERDFPFELVGYNENSEYIYYLIQKGEKGLAGKLLDEIDVSSIPDWNKGFYYFYKGKITGDKNSFYSSVEWFRNAGDRFYLQLPIQELEKLGENSLVLKMLST